MLLIFLLCVSSCQMAVANNLNNNKNNNANINALIPVYNSDTNTSVTNSHVSETKIPVGSAILPTVINSNNCVRTIGIGGNGRDGSGVVSFPIESSFCKGQLLAADFPRYSPMWYAIKCQEKIFRKADKAIEANNCPSKKSRPKIEYKYPSPRR